MVFMLLSLKVTIEILEKVFDCAKSLELFSLNIFLAIVKALDFVVSI